MKKYLSKIKYLISIALLIGQFGIFTIAHGALLWQSGAELQSATALMEYDTVSGSPTIDTTTKRSGNASIRFNTTGTAKYIQHVTGSGTTDMFLSAHCLFNSFPASNTKIMQLYDGGVLAQSIQVTSAGVVQFWDSTGAQHGSDGPTLSTGVWYNLQLSGRDTPAEQEAWIDGVQIGTTGGGYAGNGIRLGVDGSVTMDMYCDDIIVNSDGGSAQNSFPSITSKIVHLQPDASGDSNTFEKSGGGAGSSTNYQDVDEVTPDDATSFLARDTGASNQAKDLYNAESSSSAGIGSSDTIVLVAVGGRGGSDSATSAAGRNINWGIKAGGTEAWSGSTDMSINGYTTNADPVPRSYKYIGYVDPSDSGAWTIADIDALQIGVRANSSATTVLKPTTVWASIQYEASSSSAIKTVVDLVKASVKTVNGLAIASVKSWNGLQ